MRRSWLGLSYGAILLVTYLLTASLNDGQMAAVSSAISTNVNNMSERPVRVLIASAMVIDGYVLMWGTLAVVTVIIAQRWIGARWTLLFAVLGNAVPTLVTLALINYGLTVGWYDPSIKSTDDYGVSYVVATMLGVLFWRIRGYRWRAVYLALGAVWLITMGALEIPQDFTALGHVVGYIFGIGLGAVAVRHLARPRDSESTRGDREDSPPASPQLLGVGHDQNA